MTERQYQSELITRLEEIFPGCVILKNDSGLRQGIPDLTILWNQYWATLEVKMSDNSKRQPNQEYYIQQLNEMSFAACIYPENEEDVLSALQQAFKPSRRARVSQS